MSAAATLSPSHAFEHHLGKRSRSAADDEGDYFHHQGKRTRPFSNSRRTQGLQTLQQLYPSMAEKDLLHVLEICDDDVEAAIRRLDSLNLGVERRQDEQPHGEQAETAQEARGAEGAAAEELNLPRYVESLVQEMAASRDVDDARQRATRALQHFEGEVKRSCDAKNSAAQGQLAAALRENALLKRAVAIQNTRHQEFAQAASAENEELKKQLSRAQQELQQAQMTNYSLSLHLREAMSQQQFASQRNSDVF